PPTSTLFPYTTLFRSISIFENNLDEFIMIRLAGIKDQIVLHKTVLSPDGRTAEQQLAAIRQKLAPLIQEVRQYWRNELLPLLARSEEHTSELQSLAYL